MKKIRFLKVQFAADIDGWEIPAFRGAVIKKTGEQHITFHNHINDKEVIYRYPVIQYKRIGRNPALICVDFGVDEVHHFFNNRNLDIEISGRKLSLGVKNLQMNQFNLQVWEKTFTMHISQWLALNQENHAKYMATADELSRLALLESILKGNILSFAKGIGWDIDREISLRIDTIEKVRPVTFKEQKVLAFDVTFRTNVFLPDYLGLGKGVSLGFGTVRQMKK
ncbi:CRISPR-associated endonuclease Cas6 [Runella sp.]|uniref:CRISPR-associated endonuclease Cas6 n=1 Tax=Runella sp. TaxID=1960881 RepID=UPI002620AF97|nr:CRISPR-associated endonuclease Cas6 [Runella sp.]